MPRVTPEQIARAKQIDLLSYLRQYEPQELVKVGSTEYTTRTHDSLRISENGKWHWCSQGVGGTTALNYLICVKGMDFVCAVRWLCEAFSAPTSFVQPVQRLTATPAKAVVLPPADNDNAIAIAYLCGRGIDSRVVRFCLEQGLLYQTTRCGYHNCVFLGKDETGRPRYATLRGCGGSFRGDVAGSQKKYGFALPAQSPNAEIVEVYEAPIDALSGASLRSLAQRKDWRTVHYLALGGLNYLALDHFLQVHPQVHTLCLCLDNDEPGRTFTQKLTERYAVQGYTMDDAPPPCGKDYNEALQLYGEKLRRREVIRKKQEVRTR